MKTHRDLDAWKLGIELANTIYELTRGFPREELYGLSSQMRRAAVSVPTNIAEGAARESVKDFRRFLFIARGSLAELETLLLIASKSKLISEAEENNLLASRNRVAKTLQGLIRSLNT